MSKLDSGSVELPLRGGDPVVLQPTIAAARDISRHFNGLQGALVAVNRLDLEAVGFIVAAGVGENSPKGREKYVVRVYEAGLMNVIGLVTRYIVILNNGGVPAKDGEDGAGAAKGEGADQ